MTSRQARIRSPICFPINTTGNDEQSSPGNLRARQIAFRPAQNRLLCGDASVQSPDVVFLAVVLAVLVWSGIGPKDRLTWWLCAAMTISAVYELE